jgi:hypothetical protein
MVQSCQVKSLCMIRNGTHNGATRSIVQFNSRLQQLNCPIVIARSPDRTVEML